MLLLLCEVVGLVSDCVLCDWVLCDSIVDMSTVTLGTHCRRWHCCTTAASAFDMPLAGSSLPSTSQRLVLF